MKRDYYLEKKAMIDQLNLEESEIRQKFLEDFPLKNPNDKNHKKE
ncbi:MAG: hypothetical protein PHP06_04425 [Clostridia bacterium]|nr:hypothetical protein [Clostridia bacterium]